jgi:hypothetical protein
MLKLVFAQIIFAKSYEKDIRTNVVRTKVFLPENQFSFINSFWKLNLAGTGTHPFLIPDKCLNLLSKNIRMMG